MEDIDIEAVEKTMDDWYKGDINRAELRYRLLQALHIVIDGITIQSICNM